MNDKSYTHCPFEQPAKIDTTGLEESIYTVENLRDKHEQKMEEKKKILVDGLLELHKEALTRRDYSLANSIRQLFEKYWNHE